VLPLVEIEMLPVPAWKGTVTTIWPVVALTIVAFFPLKKTLSPDIELLKLVPVMVTVVVAGPSVGLVPLIIGFAVICVVSAGGGGGVEGVESFFEQENNKRLVVTKKLKERIHEDLFIEWIFGQNIKLFLYRIAITVLLFPGDPLNEGYNS